MPASAAAAAPSDGSPTTAHHEPAALAPAASASASHTEPSTATTVPRDSAPRGNSASSGDRTGRGSAGKSPGGGPSRSRRSSTAAGMPPIVVEHMFERQGAQAQGPPPP